jgi:hypothetical protein
MRISDIFFVLLGIDGEFMVIFVHKMELEN